MQTVCPECEGIVPLPNDARRGELVTCPDCGVALELINMSTLQCEVSLPNKEDFGE